MEWFDSISEVIKLLIAAGVGSALTQFVSRSGERRTLRAKVRDELSIVEELRWAVLADESKMETRNTELHEARRRLQSAAMIARLPRELIDEYDRLAIVALDTSKDHLDDEVGSYLPGPVSECVEEAYELVCDQLWHPVIAKLRYKRRFRKLTELVETNTELPGGNNLRFRANKA